MASTTATTTFSTTGVPQKPPYSNALSTLALILFICSLVVCTIDLAVLKNYKDIELSFKKILSHTYLAAALNYFYLLFVMSVTAETPVVFAKSFQCTLQGSAILLATLKMVSIHWGETAVSTYERVITFFCVVQIILSCAYIVLDARRSASVLKKAIP